MIFTNNKLNTQVADISPEEVITSLSVKAWAGQAGASASFRIANDSTEDLSLALYSTSISIELSADDRNWSATLNYAVKAGKVGDTVYVRCLARIDEVETDSTAYIVAGSERLRIDYYLAPVNEYDTAYSQSYKYEGQNTREVREFFNTDGEAVIIYEWEPLPKPDFAGINDPYIHDLDRYSIREQCNPFNAQVGYRRHDWPTKAFVGDRNTLMNASYNLQDIQLSFGDTNAILLPHDFEGFTPSPEKTSVVIGEMFPEQFTYQRTQWTILRDNREYALRNIRRVGFFKGQILFWYCELIAVNYPGGISTSMFLPWNILYDADGKEISFVPEWSTQVVDADPYEGY